MTSEFYYHFFAVMGSFFWATIDCFLTWIKKNSDAMLILAVIDCGDNGDGLITVCDFGSYRILMYIIYLGESGLVG